MENKILAFRRMVSTRVESLQPASTGVQPDNTPTPSTRIEPTGPVITTRIADMVLVVKENVYVPRKDFQTTISSVLLSHSSGLTIELTSRALVEGQNARSTKTAMFLPMKPKGNLESGVIQRQDAISAFEDTVSEGSLLQAPQMSVTENELTLVTNSMEKISGGREERRVVHIWTFIADELEEKKAA